MSTTTWHPGRAVPNPEVRRGRPALVAVDGTSESIAALIWLIDHGHLQSGELRLVTVGAGEGGTAGAEQALAAAPDLTRRHRRWLDDAPWYAVAAAPSHDDVADAIALLAGPDDIIVVGAKPAGPGPHGASLPHSLAARSPVPVVVVPENRSAEAADTVHLLVGELDGRDQPDRPLRYAAREALRRGMPLHLLHGWHVPRTHPIGPTVANAGHDDRRRAAHAAIDAAQRQAEGAFPAVHLWCQVVEGPVPEVLLPQLNRAGIAVVGRSGARQTVPGSVAMGLVAALPCPVAVVPLDRHPPRR